MNTKQVEKQELSGAASKNTTIFKHSPIQAEGNTSNNKNASSSTETIAKIVQQFNYRDIKATFVKEASATRTTTYFFELDKHRLNDIVRIDSTMRRILEIALETSGISILAPIPETSQIAVIVPKNQCEVVRITRFVDEIKMYKHKIPCVLGEDHLGHPLVLDLAECHHQLLGGATGSGKSNLLKAIITAIAMTCDNKSLKLLLVDGKGIDLVAFNKIPHLLCPVITEKEKAVDALRWLSEEMECRRSFLQEQNISDIWIYNEQCLSETEVQSENPHEPLPAILLIIDEVQVLMNGKNEEAEGLLRRITQQGRACGIIAILATQRPSVDIIQGSIKINLPGRIAFNLPSQVDSRVILDQPGAELLKSKGDMLVSEPPFGKVIRLQAPLVSDTEIQKVCDSFDCQKEGSYDADTEIHTSKLTLTQVVPPSKVKHDNQDLLVSRRIGKAQLHAEIYQIPVSTFAKVLVEHEDIAKWIAKRYSDRSWQIELVYYPFLYGQVRESFHTFKVLYDVRNGKFIRSFLPLYTVEIDSLLEGLNGELEVFACLRDANSQITAAKDIIISGERHSEAKETYITKLIERGIVGTVPKGYYIQRDFARVPRLSDKLCLTDIPEIFSKQTLASYRPAGEIIEQLRVKLWKLWQATLESHLCIGLPIYRAVSTQNDILMFIACNPIWKLKMNQWFSRHVNNYSDKAILK